MNDVDNDWKTKNAVALEPGDILLTAHKGEAAEATVTTIDWIGRNRNYPKMRVTSRIGEANVENYFFPDTTVRVRRG